MVSPRTHETECQGRGSLKRQLPERGMMGSYPSRTTFCSICLREDVVRFYCLAEQIVQLLDLAYISRGRRETAGLPQLNRIHWHALLEPLEDHCHLVR